MRSRKGVGTIVVVFLAFGSIMSSMGMLMISTAAGNEFTRTVNARINYHTDSNVAKESTIAVTMHDYMWRTDGISQDKYDDKTAHEIISYYYSTPGDQIYIGENSIEKSEVKSDIKKYLKSRLDEYILRPSVDANYQFLLQKGEGKKISVENARYKINKPWHKDQFQIGLTNGETADAVLWTKIENKYSQLPNVGSP